MLFPIGRFQGLRPTARRALELAGEGVDGRPDEVAFRGVFEQFFDLVGVPAPNRGDQPSKRLRLVVAVGLGEQGDPVFPPGLRAGGDEVLQDRTRLDRGQLVRVPDDDQSRVGLRGLEELPHEREIDHRGLIDDDYVGFEGPVGVSRKTHPLASHSERSLHRRGLGWDGVEYVVCRVDACLRSSDGVAEAGCGLSGRREEHDTRRGCSARFGVFYE